MASNEICRLTVEELASRLRAGEVSPVEATDAVLERIEELNPKVNAFTTVCAGEAREAAKTAEAEIRRGIYRGPLHGVPIGVKDLYDTKGLRTTYGSGMFRDHLPERDAGIVKRLKKAGAVIVGKTATHEWGLGLTTNNHFFGPTRNPWNLDYVPGGSSGGSGAAVASDMVFIATGSDGGGSIRFPSAWNGVLGIKPTLGLVSNVGEFGERGSSIAVPGPIGKTLRDCALMLQVVAGFDPEYPWSVDCEAPDYLDVMQKGIAGLVIGTSPDYFSVPVDPDVRSAYDASLRRLESLGARIEEFHLPNHELVVPNLFVIMGGEAVPLFERIQSERTPEYGPGTDALVELGLSYTLSDYAEAQANRQLIMRDYRAAFQAVDAIVLPTAPVPAPKIGGDYVTLNGEEHFIPQLCCGFTAPANLVGLPSVAVPAGLSQSGLPIGVQVMAPHFEEEVALRIARALMDGAPQLRSPFAA